MVSRDFLDSSMEASSQALHSHSSVKPGQRLSYRCPTLTCPAWSLMQGGLVIEEVSSSLSALSERDFQGQRELHIHVENLYGVDDLEDFVQEANLAALRRGQENVLT